MSSNMNEQQQSAARDLIEDKLTQLLKQVLFCQNNYDYHHKNNELDILQEQCDMLKGAGSACKGFLHKVRQMRRTLVEATKRCDKVDELLEDLVEVLHKPKPTESTSSCEEECYEDKENKRRLT